MANVDVFRYFWMGKSSFYDIGEEMRTVTLDGTELNYLRVLFDTIFAATDPSLVKTKTAVFVDRKIIADMEQAFFFLGRSGTVAKLSGARTQCADEGKK